MAQTLKRGANAIIERDLKQADGSTALNFSALTYAAVELWQGDLLIETYVLGEDAELRQGSSATQIELEITEAQGLALVAGVDLELWWETHVADDDFSVDADTHQARDHADAVDVFTVV